MGFTNETFRIHVTILASKGLLFNSIKLASEAAEVNFNLALEQLDELMI